MVSGPAASQGLKEGPLTWLVVSQQRVLSAVSSHEFYRG